MPTRAIHSERAMVDVPNRREFVGTFLRVGGALGAAAGLGPLACASPSQHLRILILGGTGFLGPHQVKYAVDRGHEVAIFNRGRTVPTVHQEYFDRVERLIGDRNDDLAALEGRSWDAVIDNSATFPRWVRMTTEALLGRTDRYLFVSSLSAYADFEAVGIDESYPVGRLSSPEVEDMSEYGALKAASEQVVRDAFGTAAVNVRPGLIIGPGDNTDRWTYWPVRVARGGEILAPNEPSEPVQNIDARDLAAWMVRLAESRDAGGTYNAVGNVSSFGAMLEDIRAALGSEATFTWVPTEFMTERGIRPWSHMTNWVPSEGGTLGMNRTANSLAVDAGLTFRPVAHTARDTFDWWSSLPEERRANPRAGLPADLEAEALAVWAERG